MWSGGFTNAQLFGFAANQFSGVLPDRWSFPALLQVQVRLVLCTVNSQQQACSLPLLALYPLTARQQPRTRQLHKLINAATDSSPAVRSWRTTPLMAACPAAGPRTCPT